MKTLRNACLLALSLVLLGGSLRAQSEDDARARELIAKIKKEMSDIDKLLLQADKSAPAEVQQQLEEVSKNIEELLQGVQQQQLSVVSNIEELVKLTKYSQSSQGQGQGQKDPKDQGGNQPKNRERERDGDVDELQKQEGGQEQPEGQQPKDGKQPESGAEDDSQPEQRDGEAPPPGEKGEFKREDTSGRWGNLPPKEAELLMRHHADQFPEKYRLLLEQYYRRSAEKEKGRK